MVLKFEAAVRVKEFLVFVAVVEGKEVVSRVVVMERVSLEVEKVLAFVVVAVEMVVAVLVFLVVVV